MAVVAWVGLALLSFYPHVPVRTALRSYFAAAPPALVACEAVLPDAIERLEVGVDDEAGPDGAKSFEELGLTLPSVASNLDSVGVTTPNVLQRSSFGPIASSRDVILHAHTGSGKTLAFLLPLLQQLDPSLASPQALVLCPSRELAFQIVRVAEQVMAGSGLRVCAVAGGANPARQVEKVRKEKPQLLVGTAGRVGELAFEQRKLKVRGRSPQPARPAEASWAGGVGNRGRPSA